MQDVFQLRNATLLNLLTTIEYLASDFNLKIDSELAVRVELGSWVGLGMGSFTHGSCFGWMYLVSKGHRNHFFSLARILTSGTVGSFQSG